MTWLSTITDARQFCALVSNDPDLVFVSGVIDGRPCILTLSTAAELDREMHVVGPYNSWFAAVKRDGWRLRAIKMRTRAKKIGARLFNHKIDNKANIMRLFFKDGSGHRSPKIKSASGRLSTIKKGA